MSNDHTTAAIQRFLSDLAGDQPAEPVLRALLDRSVRRLQLLCANLLHRDYRRLTLPPLNLQPEELLSNVVERLLKAMRSVHPQTVRQFFALVNQHMRWELNDLARRLDERPGTGALAEPEVAAPPSSCDSCLTPNGRRMLEAIEGLPEVEREVFDLVRIQGLTYAEAAGLVGVSEKTVQRRLNRARLLLAEQLADLRPSTSGQSGASAGLRRGPRWRARCRPAGTNAAACGRSARRARWGPRYRGSSRA